MATISVTQQPASYTINFVVSSSSYPGTPTFVRIFKNDVLFHTFTGTVGVAYSYTFSEPTIAGSLVYTVDGYANAAAAPANYDSIATTACLVKEYKPTFTLPTITCVQLNQSTSFYPTGWNQQENSLCPVTPLTRQIKYERYEFNMDTSSYVFIDDEIDTIVSVPGAVVNPENYAYTWIPDKLTMVKIVVTVTNCSTSVEKATVFPVCGTWKIRRLACGNYRIYNYKNTNLSYSLYSVSEAGDTQIPTSQIPAFSYATIPANLSIPLPDGVYKVIADGITQYIFNYCSIEACMLDLHKRILLDDSLCDECKLDKVLYQKALRLLPTYETWKKLLDKDWVYDMQYKSTDISGELARIYDAQELYLELIKLCDECSTSTKGCGCGC